MIYFSFILFSSFSFVGSCGRPGWPFCKKGGSVTNPCMGGGAVAVGMCVCMCVVGVRVDKEATGLGREGEREAYRSETDGMLKSQQVAAACPAAGVRRDRRELRPSEEDRAKIRVRVLPRFPSFVD